MAIEIAVDHLKQTFRGFKAVATFCNLLVPRISSNSSNSSVLRRKLIRACALYHGSSDISNPRRDRMRYLMKKYGRFWLKRIGVLYFRREGLFGVATVLLERMRQEKLEAEEDIAEERSTPYFVQQAVAILRPNR